MSLPHVTLRARNGVPIPDMLLSGDFTQNGCERNGDITPVGWRPSFACFLVMAQAKRRNSAPVPEYQGWREPALNCSHNHGEKEKCNWKPEPERSENTERETKRGIEQRTYIAHPQQRLSQQQSEQDQSTGVCLGNQQSRIAVFAGHSTKQFLLEWHDFATIRAGHQAALRHQSKTNSTPFHTDDCCNEAITLRFRLHCVRNF